MTDLTPAEVRLLFSSHPNLIATCRPGRLDPDLRKTLLMEAIEAGAAYVDVEFDAPAGYREKIVRRAKDAGCAVIISFHDYAGTPERRRARRKSFPRPSGWGRTS